MSPEHRAPQTERMSARAARLVLALAYLGVASLYAWQASKRASPTIFSDEAELAQISRSIAETGRPGIRGEPAGYESLYTYVLAPAWWLDDPEAAWEAAKTIGVLVMSAALFPAYKLARLVASRPWAVAAALLAVAAPPLAYAPYLLTEPLAYPVATLGLWLIAAAVAQPTRRRLALAVAACVVAPLVRGELGVLWAVLAAGVFVHAWRTDSFRRWRSTWSAGDWLGAVLLVIGLAIVASAEAGHRSDAWYAATGFLKQRTLEHGQWSLAALAMGIGVLPVIALVGLLGSKRVRATPDGFGFVVTAATACAAFTVYAAVKGAFVSTVLGPLVVERNVIYLVPLAAAATMAVLAHASASPWGVVGGLALALYVLQQAQLKLDQYPYFEAPSLAVGALANRNFSWDPDDVRRALLATALVSAALLLGRLLLRSHPFALRLALAVVAACAVGTWALTAEIYAARGLNAFAARLHGGTPRPVDWIDRATGGEPALFLGQRIDDANAIWLMEFWNRSIDRVWSLDSSAPVPTLSPDLGAPDGTLSPSPDVDWVVTGNGVEVVGEQVDALGNTAVVRVTRPVRLRRAQNGVSLDGWMGRHATFSHYSTEPGQTRGFVRVILSRQGACAANIPAATAIVRVGNVVVRDKQPALGRVLETARRTIEPCSSQTAVLRAAVPYHVDVTVSPTFVPAEVDPGSGDVRQLGVQVGFDYLPFGEPR